MYLVINIFILIILISFAWCGLSIAPFMPTRKKDLTRVHTIVALKKGEKMLEVGFGDSRVSRYIAKNNPDAHVMGVELSPFLYLFAQGKKFFSPIKNLKLYLKNGFREDFAEYDVIYLFSMPDTLKTRLKHKFLQELKPGARIVSYSFFIDNWPGETFKDKPDDDTLAIYTMIKK